jgi:hypothetical protein
MPFSPHFYLPFSSTIYSVWHLFSGRELSAYSFVMILSALTVEMAVSVIIFDVQVGHNNPLYYFSLPSRFWLEILS